MSSAETTQLLEEALGACQSLPPYNRCLELDRGLRETIGAALPIVQRQADSMDRGTPGWYTLDRVLANAREALDEDLGSGLSAALHVQELARVCYSLTKFSGAEAGR